MASTNKTTYFNLSQYIGTDKPTYLGDYNVDMLAIDTTLHGIKTTADTCALNLGDINNLNTTNKTNIVAALNEVNSLALGIGTLANLNTTDKASVVNAINEVNNKANTIGLLTNLSTTEKSSIVGSINEVNGKIGNLSSLNTTNKNNAISAINEVNTKTDSISSYFNVNNYNALSNIEVIGVTSRQPLSPTISNDLNSALNDDGLYGKIYGTLNLTNITEWPEIIIKNSGIMEIESSFNIKPAGIVILNDGTTGLVTYTIAPPESGETSARVIINVGKYNATSMMIILFPCLYYFTNFGDNA